MKSPPITCTSKKYCIFLKEKEHDTKDYYVLKKEIERLIVKGYLVSFQRRIFAPIRKKKSLVNLLQLYLRST